MESGSTDVQKARPIPLKPWHYRGFWLVFLLGSALLILYVLQLPALFNSEWRRFSFEIGLRVAVYKGDIVVRNVQERNSRGEPTPAHLAGFQEGDIISAGITEDGDLIPLKGAFSNASFVEAAPLDRPRGCVVLRGDDQQGFSEHVLFLPPTTAHPNWVPILLRFVGLKIIVPLLCLVAGLFIGLRKPDNPHALLAALLLLSWTNADAWASYLHFPPGLLDITLLLSVTLFSSLSYLFLIFCMNFPVTSPIKKKFPRLLGLLLPFPFIFSLWNSMWLYTRGYSYGLHHKIFQVWHLNYVDYVMDALYVVLFVMGFVALGWNVATAPSRDSKRRAVTILAGFLGVVPCLVIYAWWTIVLYKAPPVWFYIMALATLSFLPISFAYAVLKHRIFGLRLIVRRGIKYALLSRGILYLEGILLFLVLYFSAGPMLGRLPVTIPPEFLALLTAALTLGVITAIRRINRSMLRFLDRRFFREAYDTGRILSGLAESMDRLTMAPDELAKNTLQVISEALHLEKAAIHMRGGDILRLPPRGRPCHTFHVISPPAGPLDYFCYVRIPHEDAGSTAGPADVSRKYISTESPLGRFLESMIDNMVEPLELYDNKKSEIFPEDCGVRLIIPLISNRRLIGFLSLGEKRSEEPYSDDDKELLLAVAGQLASTLVYSQFLFKQERDLKQQYKEEIRRQVHMTNSKYRELRVLGDFVSGVAQEVRVPLHAIQFNAETMGAAAVNGERKLSAAAIQSQVDRISTLMNCLMEIGTPDQREIACGQPLGKLVGEVVEGWRGDPYGGNISIRTEIPEEVRFTPTTIEPNQLRRILGHVLKNALQHSPAGEEIRVSVLNPKEGVCRIRIHDRGDGIPKEHSERAFDPFFTTRENATGLGLTIVKHVVESYGGAVSIESSSPPPGCTVEIRLPIVQNAAFATDQRDLA